MQGQSSTPRFSGREWLVLALLISTALMIRLAAGMRTIDDAYITFRYARNLAESLGFVYNDGQTVLGTTTPFYTVLMSLAWLLGLHNLPPWHRC